MPPVYQVAIGVVGGINQRSGFSLANEIVFKSRNKSLLNIDAFIADGLLFKADTISSPCYQPDIPATVMVSALNNFG